MSSAKVQAGFTRLPNAVYGVLHESEAYLWAYLEFRQGANPSSFHSIAQIAKALNWSPSKVQRVTNSLKAKGWVKTWTDTHPSTGKARKHYSCMNRVISHERPATLVTHDHLNITMKYNQQASFEKLGSAESAPLTISKPSILEKPILEKQTTNQAKGALDKGTSKDPYPELLELLTVIPKAKRDEIKITNTLNSDLSQIMLTQNRSLAELKLWLGDPALWVNVRNGGAFLTSLFKRHLENGYTLKEASPMVWSASNRPPYCGECDPETRKTIEPYLLPNGNGAKTYSCLNCDPFMVYKYGAHALTFKERR